jgi:monovalent cation/hydrogen antiporter
MLDHFPFYLALAVFIVLLIMLANKVKVAYPVLLVVAGLLISFIPGAPKLHIDPELIFIIFLPPLLYEASWAISWKELWRWRRIIGSFAFVIVFLTALSVAFAAAAFIPGFTLALGLLLGGIVSPPDAVSAGAILKFVKVPKRMSSILEGESLLNDASSLIIFRFSLIAVATGQFAWHNALASFGWMIAGGLLIGLAVAWLFMKAHRHLPTDTNMDIILTIVAPYFMYILAEELHCSGVLAVVSGGLFLSNNRHRFLSSASRLHGVNFWESLVFLLNGFVFMLIGLDLPEITSGLGDVSLQAAIGYGLLITLVLVVVRLLAAYGAVFTTMIARNFIEVADANPGFKAPVLLGWTGMRGVVSLAAALSIPVHIHPGVSFPQRNLILFITFVVILSTLVLQGLTLPSLIRALKVSTAEDDELSFTHDMEVRKALAKHALDHLHSRYPEELRSSIVLQQLAEKWTAGAADNVNPVMPPETKAVYLDILEQQRRWLLNRNAADRFIDEDLIRMHLRQIDIEEQKLLFL